MTPQQILTFMHEMEQLKKEMRHSWLSNGRHESVAEHVWRLSLLTMLVSPHLDNEVNLLHLLKMCIAHDISEAYVGDVPSFSSTRVAHHTVEEQAMEAFRDRFSSNQAQELFDLWIEYEHQATYESKVLKALDKLEMRIQHNESDIKTWSDIEYPLCFYEATVRCEFDSFLKEFNALVENESKEKITSESTKDIDSVLDEAQHMFAKQ